MVDGPWRRYQVGNIHAGKVIRSVVHDLANFNTIRLDADSTIIVHRMNIRNLRFSESYTVLCRSSCLAACFFPSAVRVRAKYLNYLSRSYLTSGLALGGIPWCKVGQRCPIPG